MWAYATLRYDPKDGVAHDTSYSANSKVVWDPESEVAYRQAAGDGLEHVLGFLGDRGWELVTSVPNEFGQLLLILKRPVR